MKYKIDVWQWHNITETYESDSLENALAWYKENWAAALDNGLCCIEAYRDGENLSWDECYELGFY